jgi:hypothetical protein
VGVGGSGVFWYCSISACRRELGVLGMREAMRVTFELYPELDVDEYSELEVDPFDVLRECVTLDGREDVRDKARGDMDGATHDIEGATSRVRGR